MLEWPAPAMKKCVPVFPTVKLARARLAGCVNVCHFLTCSKKKGFKESHTAPKAYWLVWRLHNKGLVAWSRDKKTSRSSGPDTEQIQGTRLGGRQRVPRGNGREVELG